MVVSPLVAGTISGYTGEVSWLRDPLGLGAIIVMNAILELFTHGNYNPRAFAP